jgi:ferritin
MILKHIESALNRQIMLEGASSQFYLAMASWAENEGYHGISQFFYRQSDEERMHMLKLLHYINDRGGRAVVSALEAPPESFDDVKSVFEQLLEHEKQVSAEINEIVDMCLKEKDYTTHNFLQWYVAEQIEEEAMARNVLDKLRLIGNDKGGLYMLDRDLANMPVGPKG